MDFILGDGEIAIEVKGSKRIDPADLNGIRTFQEELHPRKCIIVCNETAERKAGKIDIMPYRNFLPGPLGKRSYCQKNNSLIFLYLWKNFKW